MIRIAILVRVSRGRCWKLIYQLGFYDLSCPSNKDVVLINSLIAIVIII